MVKNMYRHGQYLVMFKKELISSLITKIMLFLLENNKLFHNMWTYMCIYMYTVFYRDLHRTILTYVFFHESLKNTYKTIFYE